MIRPNFNKTKIIATIGPACNNKATLEKMFNNGTDVCRINFSHGTHQEHEEVIALIRQINRENNLHVCILGDLQGPKIRVGQIENDKVLLEKNADIILTSKECIGTKDKIYINYSNFTKEVKVGDKVLLDDGKLELEITKANKNGEVNAKVIHGGELKSRKGVNLPNTKLLIPSLTDKDLVDLDFALEHDLEWIGLSFVRFAEDIRRLKELIANKKKFTKVIAKIEKPDAVANIDSIIDVTDGVMIARGDLGVEIPMEQVPLLQKKIVGKCLVAAKPVIIATQMMESMIDNPRPSRAESNDVANAVIDGADCLMLSNETSVGNFPVEVVSNMQKIITHIEEEGVRFSAKTKISTESRTYLSDAICKNAVSIANEINAKAIVGMTKSGYTAFQISSFRPDTNIYIFSDNRVLLNTLNLVWGVRCFFYDKFVSTDQTFEDVINILMKKKFIELNDIVINTASMPIHEKARTNMIKVSVVG